MLEQAIELIGLLIGALRPGVTFGSVRDLGVDYLVRHGHPPHGYFERGWPAFGHQLNLGTTGPFVSEGESALVTPGMSLSLEIVVGTPATEGISHEECVIIHEDGVEGGGGRVQAQRWW